jgi:hypothetical protein
VGDSQENTYAPAGAVPKGTLFDAEAPAFTVLLAAALAEVDLHSSASISEYSDDRTYAAGAAASTSS